MRVYVAEYDRTTISYLEPLHARKVARAVERQLELIGTQSLLKAVSDLARSCALQQTANQWKVSWVGVPWRWVIVVRSGSLGGAQHCMVHSHIPVQWNSIR